MENKDYNELKKDLFETIDRITNTFQKLLDVQEQRRDDLIAYGLRPIAGDPEVNGAVSVLIMLEELYEKAPSPDLLKVIDAHNLYIEFRRKFSVKPMFWHDYLADCAMIKTKADEKKEFSLGGK